MNQTPEDIERTELQTIFEHWELFRDRIVPKDACVTQIKDMQTAFYTGAMCALDVVFRKDGEETVHKKTEILKSYQREIGLWVREVLRKGTS